MNKIWLLRPIRTGSLDPWEPWYEKAFGFVVCANSEDEARKYVSNDGNTGDENREGAGLVWLNPAYSTCEELSENCEKGIIITDFHSA